MMMSYGHVIQIFSFQKTQLKFYMPQQSNQPKHVYLNYKNYKISLYDKKLRLNVTIALI